jgi:hypothetical protein
MASTIDQGLSRFLASIPADNSDAKKPRADQVAHPGKSQDDSTIPSTMPGITSQKTV